MSNRLNTWLCAAIVALMLLGTVGSAWWFGPGQRGPSGDDRVRLAAVTQAEGTATPQAVMSPPAPLLDLLSAVPAEIPGADGGLVSTWSYADIEQQLATVGFTPEEATEDPLGTIGSNAFGALAWTSGNFYFSPDEEFVDAIGFNPFTVQQALAASTVSDVLTVFRGDWDEAGLIVAWKAAGYTEHTTERGITVWTLGPNGEIDPDHPIQSRAFQHLNNVAILDGGILVYAGTMHTLELALAAHSGEVESARDDADMAPLLATLPEDSVSLMGYDRPGSTLFSLDAITQNPNIRTEDVEEFLAPFEESRKAVGPMPHYHGIIIGITSGTISDPTASTKPASGSAFNGEIFVRLGAGSEEDAAQITRVIEWRWRTFLSQRYQWPLESVMTLTDATTEGTTVMMTFDPQGSPTVFMDLLLGNDLSPFAVDSEEWRVPGTPMATPEG